MFKDNLFTFTFKLFSDFSIFSKPYTISVVWVVIVSIASSKTIKAVSINAVKPPNKLKVSNENRIKMIIRIYLIFFIM